MKKIYIIIYVILAVILSASALGIPSTDANLVLHYTGEDGLTDSSGNGYTPVNNSVHTTTTNCPSACSSCFTFDGTNSWLNTTYISGDSQEITLFARVYKTDNDFASVIATYNPSPQAHSMFYRDTRAFYLYFLNNAVGLLNSAGTYGINNEHSFASTIFVNDTAYFYVNGTLDNHGQENNGALTRAYLVGASGIGGADNRFGGQMCDIVIMNRSLNASDMLDLHNNGIEYPAPSVDVYNSQIDLLFANASGYRTDFFENDLITGYINWSLSSDNYVYDENPDEPTGTAIDDGNYSSYLTLSEGTTYYWNYTTLITTTNASFQITDGTGTSNNTIPSDCLNTKTQFRGFNPSGLGKINVDCLNSSGGWVGIYSQEVSADFYEESVHWNNRSLEQGNCNITSGGTTYNTSWNEELGLFESDSNFSYSTSGSKTIYCNCSHLNSTFDNSTSESITINNTPPSITYISATMPNGTNITLSNKLLVQYAYGNWTFLSDATDDDISTYNLSVYNSSQMIATSQNTTSLILSSDFFTDFETNPFVINMTAIDGEGARASIEYEFNFTDTTNPSCTFDSYYNFINLNQDFDLDVVCTDEHFYSLNITCATSGWSFFADGLNVQSFTLNESYPSNTTFAQDTCSYRYCDAHTNNKIKLVPVSLNNKSEVTIVSDGFVVGKVWVEDGEVEYEEEKDKVKFKIHFDSPSRSVFYQTFDDAVYLQSPEFLGWVVSSRANTWFDMNNLLDVPVVTINRGEGLYEFIIMSAEKVIETESLGELNCVSGSFTIFNAWSDNYGTWTPFTCPLERSEAEAIGYIGILFFFLALIWFNITKLRIKIVDVFLPFIIGFIGLQLWACNRWYVYFIWIFAFGYFLYAIVNAFKDEKYNLGV